VEYFAPASEADFPTILIRRKSAYLLLEGSATILTNELLDTYRALTGPPPIFSEDRLAGDEVGEAPDSTQICEARALRFYVVMSGNPSQQVFRIYPGSDPESFRSTGFAADDLIVAINGRAVVPGDDLYRVMHDAANGKPVTFSVKRGGALQNMTLQPPAAKRALAACAH